MNDVLRNLLVAAAVAVATLVAAAAAGAVPAAQLRPLNLTVADGAENWHPTNGFRLDWDHPQTEGHLVPVAARHLRIRNAAGEVVVPEVRLPGDETVLEPIHVPYDPGRYIADLWLEGSRGEIGDMVSATLLFDDARPGLARPLPPTGWVAGGDAVIVDLEHPPVPWPVSGIRGYAVSVDDGSGSAPCGGPDACKPAEIDLSGGGGDDRISLGLLPDGVNVVRAVAVSGAGLRSLQATSAIVRVDGHDPEVFLGAPGGWAEGPARVTAVATDTQSGMAVAGANGPYTAIAVDGNVPRVELGASAAATVTGEGSHRVSFYARDAAGNLGDQAPRSTVVRIDETPPRVAFAVSQDPAEPERIEATVRDSLSGPDPVRGTIGVRPSGSKQPFVALPTVVAQDQLVAHWDSDAFAARTYEFRATAYDAAGNAAGSDRRANGTRMVLVNPVKTPTSVEAGFGGSSLFWQRCARHGGHRRCEHETVKSFESRPTLRTVPHGHSVAYSGRLRTAAGPLPEGLAVEVVERFGAGAVPPQRITVVRTAADGTFALELSAGPSRRIMAIFPGNRTLTRAAGGEVELRVQAGLRLHASSPTAQIGGAPVIFSGRLLGLGAPLPPHGQPVELQFRLPGHDWSEFRTVQTDARGRFRYPYSFSDDDSRGVRFQFRAYTPAQPGWPYEPATSRPVFVTGR